MQLPFFSCHLRTALYSGENKDFRRQTNPDHKATKLQTLWITASHSKGKDLGLDLASTTTVQAQENSGLNRGPFVTNIKLRFQMVQSAPIILPASAQLMDSYFYFEKHFYFFLFNLSLNLI